MSSSLNRWLHIFATMLQLPQPYVLLVVQGMSKAACGTSINQSIRNETSNRVVAQITPDGSSIVWSLTNR